MIDELTKQNELIGKEWQVTVRPNKEQDLAAQKQALDLTARQLEEVREEKNELEIYRAQTEKELIELRREIKAMAQAQLEWKNSVVQIQNDRNTREQEWQNKEKTWLATKTEWEKTIAELEKAKAEAAAAAISPPPKPRRN